MKIIKSNVAPFNYCFRNEIIALVDLQTIKLMFTPFDHCLWNMRSLHWLGIEFFFFPVDHGTCGYVVYERSAWWLFMVQ
jgi:hypothetical protein